MCNLNKTDGLAASPVEQPAAAPICRRHVGDSKFEGWYSDYAAKGEANPKQIARDAYAAGMGDMTPQPAPSPEDERAAFEAWVSANTSLPATCDVRGVYVNITVRAWWTVWQARAASATETGAEGATQFEHIDAQNHTMRRTLQRVMARLTSLLDEDQFADIESIVKGAGVEPPAMAAEAVAIPAGYALVPVEPTPEILTAIWQNERDSRRAWERAIAAAPQPAQADARVGLTDAVRDVLAERRRQVEAEGWTPEHDDAHSTGDMALAAACYAVADNENYPPAEPPDLWPWDSDWWKPTDERRNLVKAGALILAEIERLDRAAARAGGA